MVNKDFHKLCYYSCGHEWRVDKSEHHDQKNCQCDNLIALDCNGNLSTDLLLIYLTKWRKSWWQISARHVINFNGSCATQSDCGKPFRPVCPGSKNILGQNERNSARFDAVTMAADNCKPISLLGRGARPIPTAPSPNWTGAGDVPFRV